MTKISKRNLISEIQNKTDCKPQKQTALSDVSSALAYLNGHFDEIPLVKRRELIRRVIKKVVWNGENLDIFLVGAEETDEDCENIVISSENPSDQPEKQPPEDADYQNFRKSSDKVVKAYIKANNLTLKQLAVKCGVSYASAKYWANKRNSPSKELYERYFKEFFLREYKWPCITCGRAVGIICKQSTAPRYNHLHRGVIMSAIYSSSN